MYRCTKTTLVLIEHHDNSIRCVYIEYRQRSRASMALLSSSRGFREAFEDAQSMVSHRTDFDTGET